MKRNSSPKLARDPWDPSPWANVNCDGNTVRAELQSVVLSIPKRRRSLKEPTLNRRNRGVRAFVHPELVHRRADMVLHRALANSESIGDLLV